MAELMLQSRTEIEPYMPHSGAMLLLDRVTDHGAEHIVAETDVGAHLPFYRDGQVPAYLGIELMAQSVAAWFGIRRANPATRPPVGFLLGTQRFESTVAFFKVGSTLRTRAQQVLENEQFAQFECEIDLVATSGEGIVQTNVSVANINVYSAQEKVRHKPQ